jgi:purine-binding chemotaxis protein CheW
MSSEFLTFRLGGSEYGIGIQCVQEIRGYTGCTDVAGTADYMHGVLNLRGIIVPVIDLRIRLGTGAAVCDQLTVIIVVNIGERTAGLVVDRVTDVVMLAGGDMRPAPSVGHREAVAHLLGVGMHNDRMLQLLDIEKVTQYDDEPLALAA